MGYRERLSSIPKEELKKYKNIEIEEYDKVMEDNKNSKFYQLPKQKELLYLCTSLPIVHNEVIEIFSNFDSYKDREIRFQEITKKGLLEIIELYRTSILSMIEDDIKRSEIDPLYAISKLEQKKSTWGESIERFNVKPYVLKEDDKDLNDYDGQVASNYSIEYQIFNLTYIYNTFDWDKNHLIITGW